MDGCAMDRRFIRNPCALGIKVQQASWPALRMTSRSQATASTIPSPSVRESQYSTGRTCRGSQKGTHRQNTAARYQALDVLVPWRVSGHSFAPPRWRHTLNRKSTRVRLQNPRSSTTPSAASSRARPQPTPRRKYFPCDRSTHRAAPQTCRE
jgi:hypothetical protein